MRRSLRTAPIAVLILLAACSAFAAPWKFAVFCDMRGEATGVQGSELGVRTSVVAPIAKAIAREHVDLVVVPGDLANGSGRIGDLKSQLLAWKRAMSPVYGAGIPVYVMRGNHENQQEDPVGVWDSVFPSLPQNGPSNQKDLSYSVTHKGALFLVFDPYTARSSTWDSSVYDSSKNYGMINPWVLSKIKNSKEHWVFAFGHEPAFVAHHMDCMANAPAERDAFWDALGAKHGLYMCGHDHFYSRRTASDTKGEQVTELIVGDGGAPRYPLDHNAENAKYDRHVVPTIHFMNADLDKGVNKNTGGHAFYYGYVIITVDGNKAVGEWKAFVNYDYTKWSAPAKPEFKTMDRFELMTK